MRHPSRTLACLLFGSTLGLAAQGTASLEPTPRFSFVASPLTIRQAALPNHPFTVTGRSGAILGMQDGTTEVWQLPTKFFGGLRLRAEVEGYSVPIELNPLASELEVSPDHTTLTYAHAAITVKQHMFVPAGEGNDGMGGMVVFEIHAIHPAVLTVSLTPAMVRMWPAPQWGQPGWGWQPMGHGGAYSVATDNPELFGLLAMPDASAGAVSPYQEHPHTLPVEFRVHFDPKTDADQVFPLLCELNRPGERNDAAGQAALRSRVLATAQALPSIYARTAAYYATFFDHRTVVHTPDPTFDLALRWAELAIEKAQATIPAQNGRPAETGLVAGWFPSFDSARPGFGWFFGRDSLWSMYAIDSYGDGALAREVFGFLLRRQRPDGKIMHEFSQTAESLSGDMQWDKLPYEYAAADATPLFVLALDDYLRATGDLAFVQQHWDAIDRAYRFERSHDSDGDGTYDNSEGTGWVEDWPHQPHQEVYLAALDRDATLAFSRLAERTGHTAEIAPAQAAAQKIAFTVERYHQRSGLYAFSKDLNGGFDATATVYPSVALWSSARGFAETEPSLRAWAGHGFETDWGTRAIAETDPFYDPISYHRGSVWPLFTGWTAMAEYRGGHPVSGYAALRSNLDLTWAQDPGSVTEVLSGAFYEPLGRSSTHQLWSSAMVLAPALRELFGLEPDAPAHTLAVHPHLPPEWGQVALEHLHIGPEEYALSERRDGAQLIVEARSVTPSVLCLRSLPDLSSEPTPCAEAPATTHRLALPLPPLEVSLASAPLLPGSETLHPHVLAESYGARSVSLELEAPAGSTVRLHLRRNGPAALAARTQDGQLQNDQLKVTLPTGSGWQTKHITLSW